LPLALWFLPTWQKLFVRGCLLVFLSPFFKTGFFLCLKSSPTGLSFRFARLHDARGVTVRGGVGAFSRAAQVDLFSGASPIFYFFSDDFFFTSSLMASSRRLASFFKLFLSGLHVCPRGSRSLSAYVHRYPDPLQFLQDLPVVRQLSLQYSTGRVSGCFGSHLHMDVGSTSLRVTA